MADSIRSLLLALAASHPDVVRAAEEERQARLNSPEARARRSARSRKAAATVRARREAQQALEDREAALTTDGPTCGAMDVVMDAQEVFCNRPPHEAGDHEDIDGHIWAREEED